MAALAITPTSVVKGANASVDNGIAGATIAAGQAVYKNSVTSKFELSDADGVGAETKTSRGIALNGAALNQPLVVQYDGDIVIGAAVITGTIYVLGDAPGGVMPSADLGAGDHVTILGVAVNTTTIRLAVKSFGVSA